MKSASAATLAILAAGQWIKAELYDLTLVTGQVYRFTDFQIPLSAAVYPSGTANAYSASLVVKRDTLTQKVGAEAGSMKVTFAPQPDSPAAPVLVAGYPLIQTARYGFLDGAKLQMSKLFMNAPAAPGGALDTSPGAVAWFLGTVQQIEIDRLAVVVTADDYLAYLGNQQMPRQLWQVGCFHQVYDAGCTLLKTTFTVTGTVSTAGDGAHFTTSLTQADDYFDLGVLTFTSGVNAGLSANVALFKHAAGAFTMRFPFPNTPGVGDAFSVYPGCDLQQATCTNKFSNLIHFSGQPYIPQPETMLDGGTDNPPAQQTGQQFGNMGGSAPSSQYSYGQAKV